MRRLTDYPANRDPGAIADQPINHCRLRASNLTSLRGRMRAPILPGRENRRAWLASAQRSGSDRREGTRRDSPDGLSRDPRAWPCYILGMKIISVADLVSLPVAERLRLVEAIWDSIAEVPEQLELSPAQARELNRRLAAFEKDPAAGSPWAEVRARLERAR